MNGLHTNNVWMPSLYTLEFLYIPGANNPGGDFDDLYPDVCVEGLEKDPF